MKYYLLTIALLTHTLIYSQGVSINTTGASASSDAMLDVSSTNSGLLIPRMTEAERDAIGSPSTSLLIYQTNNDSGLYFFDGTNWTPFLIGGAAANSGWATKGNIGTDPTTNFIGTIDSVDWVIKTNNNEKVRVAGNGNVGIGTTTPNAKFTVLNNTNTTSSQVAGFSRSGTGASGNGLFFTHGSAAADYNSITKAGDAGIFFDTDGNPTVASSTTGLTIAPHSVSGLGVLGIRIVENGNVGIGTADPLTQLHVAGSTGTSARLALDQTAAGGDRWDLISATNTFHGGDVVDGSLLFYNADETDNRMVITPDGNVGINIENPGEKVYVKNGYIAAGTGGWSHVKMGQYSASTPFYGLENSSNYPTSVSNFGGFVQGGINGSLVLATMENQAKDGVYFFNGGGDFVTDSTYDHLSMVVQAGGNVGIGTNDPGSHLEVSPGAVGSTSIGGRNINLGITAKSVSGRTSFLSEVTNAFTGNGDNAGFYWIFPHNSGGNAAFKPFRASTGDPLTDVFYVRQDGGGYFASDVGIGTTTPGGQLELSLDEGRKPSTTLWTTTSDARLKNIIGEYEKGLQEILRLFPITYNYKNVEDRVFAKEVLEGTHIGFSAQDVQRVFPECVGEDADGYLNLNPHAIVIAYVNAIKELNSNIENQQQLIENLQKKNVVIKSKKDNIKAELNKALNKIDEQEKRLQRLEMLMGESSRK